MSRGSEGMWVQQQQSTTEPSSPPLPADHVLFSGAVSCPGAFDQLGSPLVVFPVERQAQISSELSKAEVVDFISYCLFQHNKTQRSSFVSVVADLREASASTTRFIAETLLLLEMQKRTVHSVYIIQPKRKEVLRLLVKLWTSSKSQPVSFKKILLKEVYELSKYIDRSQLPASLGGYLVYCHQSWAVFTKEMDVFAQHFASVAQRLPGCLSSLQALSMLPVPSSTPELQLFCAANEAHFQQLQRELGLDDLLKHSELLQEKLRSPELDPHFQAVAGTALFTQHFASILRKHRRITATVKKVELMWQEVFSKPRLQLHVQQLRDAALQITEQIESLLQQKLQPYDIQIAGDVTEAERLASEFHSSVYTPAMSLVAAAEEVVHTLTELLSDAPSRERWLLDLHRLKEKLRSTVHLTLQTLRAVSKYHRYYNKARSWYVLVLSENFLQKLLSEVDRRKQRRSFGTLPTWRKRLSAFLKNSPPPNSEQLIHLAHLSNVIPDKRLQQEGMQLSQRCMTLRHLINSSEPLTVAELQVALQWQYELLRSSLDNQSFNPAQHIQHSPESTSTAGLSSPLCLKDPQGADQFRQGTMAEGKPSSLSSFDSGFDGAGSLLEASNVTPFCKKQALNQPQIQEETASGFSESEGFGSLGNSSRASVHLSPKATLSALNLEIKVKRSAAHPSNQWSSLPDDDLENSYTVTITPKPSIDDRDLSPAFEEAPSTPWPLHSHSSLENSELCSISHILSSTVTETKNETCNRGDPSMLWDSYDLHEQYLDTTEGVSDLSLKDWDIKEQENLTEVERILERTDKILTEEESVLAQETQLDALVQSEVGPHPWLAWDNQVSSTELMTANVLILDEVIPESQLDPDLRCPQDWGFKPDQLTELKEVYELDQKILEENLKIQQLGREERLEEAVKRTSDSENGKCAWSQLTKEKEDGNLEKDSSVRTCQTQKSEERASKVIRCSIMSRTESEEDRDICTGLLSKQKSLEEPLSDGKSKDMSRIGFHNQIDGNIVGSSEQCLGSESVFSTISSAMAQNGSLTNTLDHPPPEVPAQPTPDPTSFTPHYAEIEEGGALHPHPIPKPRKITSLALNKMSEQQNSHATEDRNVSFDNSSHRSESMEEADEEGAPMEEADEEGAPTEEADEKGAPMDKADEEGAPTEEADEKGAPTEEAEDGGPSAEENWDRGAPATENVEGVMSAAEDGNWSAPVKEDGNGGVSPEEMGDGGAPLTWGPKVELHANNNNNNWLPSWSDSGERLSSEDVPDQAQQTEDLATSLHSFKTPCGETVPPTCSPMYCHGREEDESWSEGTMISAPEIQDKFMINTSLPSDFETPIVLDTGSGLMKAGFADQDLPSVVFPTIIGMPKYEEIMNGSSEKDLYVGHEAQHMRGVLALRHPIKHGLISNWDDMEKIWQHTFNHLRVDPADHPVLLTEAPMNPLENKQHAMEIMFEFFGVPFCYIAMQAVLALYAAGRTTGVVLESGNGVTHSVPVYDGYTLPHAVQRFLLAGADVTANLTKLLQEQGVCMRTSAEQEIVREMKEKCCCVALDYDAELSQGGSIGEVGYTLPDGRIVTLGLERIRAPEILFKPELIGREHYGLHESVYKSIRSSDLDLRRCFLGNILLSGGNTLLPGLPERLQAELSALVPHEPSSSVRVCSPTDRDFSVWCGGAVLANMPSFCGAWIGQSEYDEYGPQIVHRKCF